MTINACPKRAEFFNFLIKSRNIAKTNQQDLLSCIMQGLETASSIKLEDIEAEMLWYQPSFSQEIGRSASPLTLTNQTAGFEYSLLD